MYYSVIKKTDVADGPGVRVSLFVSGCRNHCPGCFQPETWDFHYGQPFTAETIDEILEALKPKYITGLTILGGDPMEPENIGEVLLLCRSVKRRFDLGTKNIWLYTGYLYEQLPVDLSLLEDIDVLVDGPFVESLKDLSLRFRGSSNQRIIDVKASQEAGHVVLWHDAAADHDMHPTKPGGGVKHDPS